MRQIHSRHFQICQIDKYWRIPYVKVSSCDYSSIYERTPKNDDEYSEFACFRRIDVCVVPALKLSLERIYKYKVPYFIIFSPKFVKIFLNIVPLFSNILTNLRTTRMYVYVTMKKRISTMACSYVLNARCNFWQGEAKHETHRRIWSVLDCRMLRCIPGLVKHKTNRIL